MDLHEEVMKLWNLYITGKINYDEFNRRVEALKEPPLGMPDFMDDIFGGFKEE